MLCTPPCLSVANSSWLSVDCGTTPKNLAPTFAAALAAKTPSARTTASAAVRARAFLLT
jgi:hypothetical protein